MTSHQLRLAGLWAIVVALGAATVISPPTTHAAAGWPVGLASGLAVSVSGRRRQATVLGVLLVGSATFLLRAPAGAAIGFGLALALEVALAARLLAPGEEPRPGITGDGARRFGIAVVAAALAGAAAFGVVSWMTGYGEAATVALAVLPAHLLSEVLFLGFFLEGRHERTGEPLAYRVVRWSGLGVVTLVAILPSTGSVIYLVLPLLAWTALRASWVEALWSLLFVSTMTTIAATTDGGPFGLPRMRSPLPAEVAHVPQLTFVLGCSLVVIPLAMAVNRLRNTARDTESQRRRLARILDNASSTAIIETDAEGRVLLFNSGAEAILGYTSEEIVGQIPYGLIAVEELARHARELAVPPDSRSVAYAQAATPDQRREWVYRRKDGELVTLSITLTPVEEDGRFTGFLSAGEDVTDRVRAQHALEAALEKERDVVSRLVELDRTKEVFTSNVSHELRTPIANIVGYLELLIDGDYGEPSPDQLQALTRIEGNSLRLLDLVNDLLLLSRTEALELRPDLTELDLRHVAEAVAADLGPAVTQHDHDLVVDLADKPVMVLGDQRLLDRVVGNLATNAIKFTPDGGRITIRVACTPEGPVVEVSDTGIGLSTTEQDQLFDRFYRSTYAQDNAIQGTGLGLSIARSIAQMHGARIAVSSTHGVGTTFRVTFDAAIVPAQRGRTRAEPR